MTINFYDLQKKVDPEITEAIAKVIEHGQFINGLEVGLFEHEFSGFSDIEYVIGCGSGTDALLLSLMAYGIGPGDAVFTTPFTFISTAEVILTLGATPIFVDINPRTFNINPERLVEAVHNTEQERKLKPKAIIAVNMFGLPAYYNSINTIAKNHNLFVIEDAAQSTGATYCDKSSGTLGDIAATSFFPTKPLGAFGDAGAVLTNDDALAKRIRSIKAHGQGYNKYEYQRRGIISRLDTIQAAVLRVKLKRLPKEIRRRQEIANIYNGTFNNRYNGIRAPYTSKGNRSAWAQYSILFGNRDKLKENLSKKGIPTAIYYPKPLHTQEVFQGLGYKEGDFPITEDVCKCILSLPIHPSLTNEEVKFIISSVIECSNKGEINV